MSMYIITSARNRLTRILLYAWAAPASAIGFCAAVFALFLGATWYIVDGVVEVGGGRISSLLRLFPRVMRFEAITLGHVVLGLNHTIIETHRLHEHAHVRQYERWGLLFFPLYLGSSLTQLWSGQDPHRQNCFEREAYKHETYTKVMTNSHTR